MVVAVTTFMRLPRCVDNAALELDKFAPIKELWKFMCPVFVMAPTERGEKVWIGVGTGAAVDRF